ncbi:MAG: response regulator [Hyphomonadaceae bacterium]
MTAAQKLAGLRVLVLEDEALVSMMLEAMLEEMGCTIVGPFLHLEKAVDFIAANPGAADAALLDVNVAGKRSTPAADLLAAQNIPFAFCTGYDAAGIEEAHRAAPRLSKPFMQKDIEAALLKLAPARAG